MATNVPKTCKAVVLQKPGDPFAITEIPLESPQEGQVLIKVHACGVCFSDVGLQQGHFDPMYASDPAGDAFEKATFPVIPGHEVIGTIVQLGPGEKRWKVGDRVGGPWHGGHDGVCKACNRAMYQMCDNGKVNGVSRNGGYAEYCSLRSEAVVRIPHDADPAEYAPLLCAGVTVFNGIRKMNVTPGDVVAVQGLGGLGHLALQYSRKMGYRTVAISSSSDKKDFAMSLGANAYIDTSKEDPVGALQKMGGAALVVITAPNPKIMGPMVNACQAGGKVLVLAPVGDIPINSAILIGKGASVHGWPSGHALDSEEAIQFAEDHGVKCMIEKYPFAKVSEAVDRLTSGKARFRVVLTMD